MTKEKKKAFDAVKMMREIRNQLQALYFTNPEGWHKELEKVRKSVPSVKHRAQEARHSARP